MAKKRKASQSFSFHEEYPSDEEEDEDFNSPSKGAASKEASDSDESYGDSDDDDRDEFDELEEKAANEIVSGLELPKKHKLARKRIVKIRDPSKKKYRRIESKSAAFKSPRDRIQEFPQEFLIVNNSHLYCSLCDKQLDTKRSIVKNHLQSKKHLVSGIQLL